MKRIIMLSVLLCCIFIILLTQTKGEIIIVDDDIGQWTDYSSIQDAINASHDNDTIRVYTGLFDGQLSVNKSIHIIGNGSNNTVIIDTIGQNITNTVGRSIVIIKSGNINISNIEIRGTHQTYNTGIDCDFFVGPIENVSFYNITFRNCTHGLEIDEVNHCSIINCLFINYTTIGMTIGGNGNDFVIQDCTFINNHNYSRRLNRTDDSKSTYYPHNWSIYIYRISNITIRECRIISKLSSNNVGGIWLSRTSNIEIIDTKIVNHTYYGIFIDEDTQLTTITSCTFINNTGFAIQANESTNSFFNNAFYTLNGLQQVNDNQNNSWDNNITGNYWSDYNGSDLNDDDIGDTPYVINNNLTTVDRYPLMKDPTIRPPKSISLIIIPDSVTPLKGNSVTIFCIIDSSSYYPYATLSFFVDDELFEEIPIIINDGKTYWKFIWTASQGLHQILVVVDEPINISDEIEISVVNKSKSTSDGFQITPSIILLLSLFIASLLCCPSKYGSVSVHSNSSTISVSIAFGRVPLLKPPVNRAFIGPYTPF